MNGPKRVYVIVGLVLLAALLIVLFGGCNLAKGRIKAPGITVQGPKDGNNASLGQEHATGVLTLPAGSTVTVTKFGAVAWEPATGSRPEVKAQPAREVTQVELSRDTTWQKEETKIAANTGTIDTTVATHRIDVESHKILLYAAIGAMVVAGIFVYLKYPTPALMCGAAAVIFFLAWKLSDLPPWFYVIGVGGFVGAVALHRGYERREKEEKAHAEELAKAKALAVPVAPPVPVVVTNPTTPSP